MKLIYKNMEHILRFGEGFVSELIIENKKMFLEMATCLVEQSAGSHGNFTLSIADKPVEFSRHGDVIMQFAPFEINRKSLLTKLYTALEKKALSAENYTKTGELLSGLESYIYRLAEDFPFELDCKKVTFGSVLRAICPEIDEDDKSNLEKIFDYMELVRELDRDRLFVMINMRTFFSDEDMEIFIQSVCLHDFKVLLLESTSFPRLKNTKRYTVDEDLCEF